MCRLSASRATAPRRRDQAAQRLVHIATEHWIAVNVARRGIGMETGEIIGHPLRKRVAKLRQSGVYPRELRGLSERRKESPCIGQMLDRKSALFLGLVKQA